MAGQGNNIKGKSPGREEFQAKNLQAGDAKKLQVKKFQETDLHSGAQAAGWAVFSRKVIKTAVNRHHIPEDLLPGKKQGAGKKALPAFSDREYRSIGKSDRTDPDYSKAVPCSETVVGFHAIEEMLKEGILRVLSIFPEKERGMRK